MKQSRQQAIEDYSIFEVKKMYRFNFTLQASRISGVTHPRITTPIRKKLRARHIEYLPSIVPCGSFILAICGFQIRPDFILACRHL
jgi:hypothetical protein